MLGFVFVLLQDPNTGVVFCLLRTRVSMAEHQRNIATQHPSLLVTIMNSGHHLFSLKFNLLCIEPQTQLHVTSEGETYIVKKALIPIKVTYTQHTQTYTHLHCVHVSLHACTLHYEGRIGYLLKSVSVFMVAHLASRVRLHGLGGDIISFSVS